MTIAHFVCPHSHSQSHLLFSTIKLYFMPIRHFARMVLSEKSFASFFLGNQNSSSNPKKKAKRCGFQVTTTIDRGCASPLRTRSWYTYKSTLPFAETNTCMRVLSRNTTQQTRGNKVEKIKVAVQPAFRLVWDTSCRMPLSLEVMVYVAHL